MNMDASMNNVINVALIPEGAAVAADNMNSVAIITPERGAVLSTAERYRVYKDIASVAADFGSTSKVYDFASVALSQSPNPVQAAGALIIAFHRAAPELVEATAATLKGAQVSESALIAALQQISDGSFSISVNGESHDITGLNFLSVSDMDDVKAILQAALEDIALMDVSDLRLIIKEEGTTGSITFATEAPTGTFIGNLLYLAEGTGAEAIPGAAEATLASESAIDALVALSSEVLFKGFCFVEQQTDEMRKDIAQWAQSNSVLGYEVFSNPANLQMDPENVVWSVKLASLTNYRMLYSKSGTRKMAAAYMALMHSVNFNGSETAKTMHLKTLTGIAAEGYTQSEISDAAKVGLDIYVTIKKVPALLTSGANDFTDNPYNMTAYINEVQTDVFNLLKTTGTKVAQTVRGVNQLTDCVEKTASRYVRAGVFAPGEWSRADTFGEPEQFKRAIREQGFFVLAGELADQSQADRQARKSPVIQNAVKNAGAIHSADIIVVFNY